jgi:hypothetical protein
MARSAIDQQIQDLLEEKERQRLAAGAAAGNRIEDHQPVYYPAESGNFRHKIGCSCTWAPKPPTRVSTMHVAYQGHLRKLGLPTYGRMRVTYGYGVAKGLTYDEAEARGIDLDDDTPHRVARGLPGLGA